MREAHREETIKAIQHALLEDSAQRTDAECVYDHLIGMGYLLKPTLPAPAPKPEFGLNDRMTWCGYTVKRKQDFGQYQKDRVGYVVTDGGIINVMPGGAWFESVADAKKGIAALELAKRIAPDNRAHSDGCDGHFFWMLMELTRK